jgi:hypothetical protein
VADPAPPVADPAPPVADLPATGEQGASKQNARFIEVVGELLSQ